jgi:hypothetical protein
MIKSILCIIIFATANILTAQKYPIPELDWDALSETKPWVDTEDWSVIPQKVTPGRQLSMPPSDAIVLFDGSNLDHWQKPKYGIPADLDGTKATVMNATYENHPGTDPEWQIKDGAIEIVPGGGNLQTKESFGDVQLHIEWLSPVDEGKEGQLYSNSGIFFMGIYELQVLNSYENTTYSNGQAGAVYKQSPPLVNACRPPGEWQSYDIIFNAPQFNDQGKCIKKACITAMHNGILIQNNFELDGPTFYIGKGMYFAHEAKMPLLLQDHGDKVRFRNIWIRNL